VEPGPTRRTQLALGLQRATGLLLSPITTLTVAVLLRTWLGLRFEAIAPLRSAYREDRRASSAPLLICGNHLTMIDSALIAYALGSPLWYVTHYDTLPWNVPDQGNFAATRLSRFLIYIYKCLPIARGGSREQVASTIARFEHLLGSGQTGLIFPEGGRSRSGRVDVENAAYGVGRIVKSVPGCRVLCVYLRGDAQQGHSALPTRGDTIRARIAWLEPKSHLRGLRGSLDISRQILGRIAELEQEHFDALA
jgi:hypothetical protein